MSFLKFFLLLSPYFFNVNTTFTSAKQYAPSVHLMFELCLSQVFSSFEFKIARAKILLETFSELYANKGDFILELFSGFKVVVLDSILPACILWSSMSIPGFQIFEDYSSSEASIKLL